MMNRDSGFRIQDSAIRMSLDVGRLPRSLVWGTEQGRGKATPVSRILCPESCKGFTLIEFIVVIIIIVVLAGLFLVRIPLYQEQAEKAAMQQVEGAIQSALVLRYGALMARGEAGEKELSILSTDNPITWLQRIPPNYKGEYYDPTPRSIAPGNWMFDLKSRDLIYVLNQSENFTPGPDGNKWIRFHVRLGYEPALGKPESGSELASTLFEPVVQYRWLD